MPTQLLQKRLAVATSPITKTSLDKLAAEIDAQARVKNGLAKAFEMWTLFSNPDNSSPLSLKTWVSIRLIEKSYPYPLSKVSSELRKKSPTFTLATQQLELSLFKDPIDVLTALCWVYYVKHSVSETQFNNWILGACSEHFEYTIRHNLTKKLPECIAQIAKHFFPKETFDLWAQAEFKPSVKEDLKKGRRDQLLSRLSALKQVGDPAAFYNSLKDVYRDKDIRVALRKARKHVFSPGDAQNRTHMPYLMFHAFVIKFCKEHNFDTDVLPGKRVELPDLKGIGKQPKPPRFQVLEYMSKEPALATSSLCPVLPQLALVGVLSCHEHILTLKPSNLKGGTPHLLFMKGSPRKLELPQVKN